MTGPVLNQRGVQQGARSFRARHSGRELGDANGFAGAPKGAYAKAMFYHRQGDGSYGLGATVTLLNPVAPVEFFVSDQGYLITLDNWHNMGYGKVLALYGPDGAPIKSYELKDLFSEEEISRFEHSVSSIWWHKGPAYVDEDQKVLFISLDDKEPISSWMPRWGPTGRANGRTWFT